MTLNDEAWKSVFRDLNVLERLESTDSIVISADDLKVHGQREPRLMAKMDTLNSRPSLFKKHSLSLLPIENGSYLLFKDPDRRSYIEIDSVINELQAEPFYPTQVDLGSYDTLQLQTITSESQAIDYVYLTHLLGTFCEDEDMLFTIRGRSRSQAFDFSIPGIANDVHVNGVQIEVDAGFESYNAIYLIEAKLGRLKSFNLRQLYYPNKNWATISAKKIITILFAYTNGLFYFIPLSFGEEFGDVSIGDVRCYTINEPVKQLLNLRRLLEITEPKSEPDSTVAPYPQADDLDKVIDIVLNYENGLSTKEAIAEYFGFEPRQANYYASAAIYLDLLKRDPDVAGTFVLTDVGRRLAQSERRAQRNLIMIQQLLARPTFYRSIAGYFFPDEGFRPISRLEIKNIIDEYHDLEFSTAYRRALTVLGWLRWITRNVTFIEN